MASYATSPDRESFDGISDCSSDLNANAAVHERVLSFFYGGRRGKNRRRIAVNYSGDNNGRLVPIREMYSPSSCNRGRAFPMRTESGDLPSLSVRLKFTQGLMKGVVVQESPRFLFSPPAVSDYSRAPSSACSSPVRRFRRFLRN